MAFIRTFLLSLITAAVGNLIVYGCACGITFVLAVVYNILKSISDSWFGGFSFLTLSAEEILNYQIVVCILSVLFTMIFGLVICHWRYRCRVPGKFWLKRAAKKKKPVKAAALNCCVLIHLFIAIALLAVFMLGDNYFDRFFEDGGIKGALILGLAVCMMLFQFIYFIYAIKHFQSEKCPKCKSVFGFLYSSSGVESSTYQVDTVYAGKEPSYTAYNGKLKMKMEDAVIYGKRTETTYSETFRCTCAYCGKQRTKVLPRYFKSPPIDKDKLKEERDSENDYISFL